MTKKGTYIIKLPASLQDMKYSAKQKVIKWR